MDEENKVEQAKKHFEAINDAANEKVARVNGLEDVKKIIEEFAKREATAGLTEGELSVLEEREKIEARIAEIDSMGEAEWENAARDRRMNIESALVLESGLIEEEALEELKELEKELKALETPEQYAAYGKKLVESEKRKLSYALTTDELSVERAKSFKVQTVSDNELENADKNIERLKAKKEEYEEAIARLEAGDSPFKENSIASLKKNIFEIDEEIKANERLKATGMTKDGEKNVQDLRDIDADIRHIEREIENCERDMAKADPSYRAKLEQIIKEQKEKLADAQEKREKYLEASKIENEKREKREAEAKEDIKLEESYFYTRAAMKLEKEAAVLKAEIDLRVAKGEGFTQETTEMRDRLSQLKDAIKLCLDEKAKVYAKPAQEKGTEGKGSEGKGSEGKGGEGKGGEGKGGEGKGSEGKGGEGKGSEGKGSEGKDWDYEAAYDGLETTKFLGIFNRSKEKSDLKYQLMLKNQENTFLAKLGPINKLVAKIRSIFVTRSDVIANLKLGVITLPYLPEGKDEAETPEKPEEARNAWELSEEEKQKINENNKKEAMKQAMWDEFTKLPKEEQDKVLGSDDVVGTIDPTVIKDYIKQVKESGRAEGKGSEGKGEEGKSEK